MLAVSLELYPVTTEPEDYGRYPVLVEAGDTHESGTAYFTHPAGAVSAGWYTSDERGAVRLPVIAWAPKLQLDLAELITDA
jgi:hypothetical protein